VIPSFIASANFIVFSCLAGVVGFAAYIFILTPFYTDLALFSQLQGHLPGVGWGEEHHESRLRKHEGWPKVAAARRYLKQLERRQADPDLIYRAKEQVFVMEKLVLLTPNHTDDLIAKNVISMFDETTAALRATIGAKAELARARDDT
jgi:hypothetical protein